MNFNDKIKNILTALGYTPKTLATETGITIRQVNHIFKDGGKIKADEFIYICTAIGITPDRFIGIGGVAV